MSAVEFANVADPLSLGANVKCIDEGGLGGGEIDLTDIKDSTGGQLQGDARTLKQEGTVRYYPAGALTLTDGATANVDGTEVVAVGQTKNGFFVTKVVPGKDNEKHSTLDVTARKHTNAPYTDLAVE